MISGEAISHTHHSVSTGPVFCPVSPSTAHL